MKRLSFNGWLGSRLLTPDFRYSNFVVKDERSMGSTDLGGGYHETL